ncbi:MAG: 30S ribosomal protein S9 [Candidatus Andersenbacteria bacterium]|nr:30S ribosomal protein S9 [Candidatus Andersenbacteria bacterium]
MTKKRYYGLGRRKTAVARVALYAGSQLHQINSQAMTEYFTPHLQQAALSPLVLTAQNDKLAVVARVSGGGKRAQAEAIKLGAARALLLVNSEWRKQLKAAGMLTRDPRVKERKKYGLKRARRAPQFSKR